MPAAGHATVSALWNFAYDAGMGAGAVAFGWLAAATGYPWAFVLTAVTMLGALVPALADRRRAAPTALREAKVTPAKEAPLQ